MNIELGNLAVAVVICVIFGRRWHRLVPAGAARAGLRAAHLLCRHSGLTPSLRCDSSGSLSLSAGQS
jgi:hypothetical protein